MSSNLPFFVYGTLRPNGFYYSLLKDKTLSEEPASVTGLYLYLIDYYPMVAHAPENDQTATVYGNLMIPKPEIYDEVLVSLDRLENYNPDPAYADYNQYIRIPYQVITASGHEVTAWIYIGRKIEDWYKRIPEGDWVAYRKANNQGW